MPASKNKKSAKTAAATPSKKTTAAGNLKAAAKVSKKDAKLAAAAPVVVNEDDMDEDAADAGSSSGAGSAEMLAGMTEALGKPGEIATGSLKNFRHHPDIESFYRFIFENDLRYEALGIIDQILTEKRNRKKLKVTKAQVH